MLLFLAVGYLLGNTFGIGTTGFTVQTQTQGSTQTGSSGTQTGQGSNIILSNPFDDDPIIGDKNAEVVVVEFSDFQCPFCRRFYVQTLPQLEQEYINTGKVVMVYRDFPLDSIHPGATPAALGAECAEEQGKWREMHNKIFDEQNTQGTGTIDFSAEDVKRWASEVTGIDATKFNQCLDSGKYLQEVQKDFQDGVNAGVTGTPTFYIGNAQKGFTQIVGAQPYSVLKQVIDQYLA